jgi:uncharacterized protein (TIGR02680 family)
LLDDPTMQDANRIESAERDAAARCQAMQAAETELAEFDQRLQREVVETQQCAERVAQAKRALTDVRQESAAFAGVAGIAGRHAENALAVLDSSALVELSGRALETAVSELRSLMIVRREQIALMRQRHAEVAKAEEQQVQRLRARYESQNAAEAAAERRADADARVELEGRALVEAWDRHFTGLKQLQLEPQAPLVALAEWVVGLNGDNPALAALQASQQQASVRLAARRVELTGQRQALASEWVALEAEHARLEAGVDAPPPLPHTRGEGVRSGRSGAPLWKLIDFRDTVDEARRAGIEAALEAAGMLDAWVAPDGKLQTGDGGALLHDTQALLRKSRELSLADWLQVSVPHDSAVPAAVVGRLLAGVACGEHDPADGEAWIAPDGRFRLGPLAGAWSKSAAVYLGFAARAAARARRLAEIAERLVQLAGEASMLQAQFEQHTQSEQEAGDEWRLAPKDLALRNAHLTAAACAGDYQAACERLAQADAEYRETEQALDAARGKLARDAADLRLPEAADARAAVEAALDQYKDAQYQLAQAAHELRRAETERLRQCTRENEARDDFQRRAGQCDARRVEAEEANVRLHVLRAAVGVKVDELKQQLAEARAAVRISEQMRDRMNAALNEAGQARAVAHEKAATAEEVLGQRSEARAQAVSQLQQFAASGLLSVALPQAELPDMASPWTIDPALTLARRAEQALADIKDDDDSLVRVRKQTTEEWTELQRALTALGHQATADPSDWGLIVHIVYQNRPERPDRLIARLNEDIAQRSELLTAKERAVLENHLQAEIAAEVQRLLQGAKRQVDAINKELHKRPTSTGVRFRLLWQPLPEEEGAPVGLAAAHERLLNTSADLWSADDRRIVGAMLQQSIAAERERSDDAVGGKDGDSTLLDQLSRALDYRRWHRFRVERWQDGHWRKLSGPASSGERALGLTVPLFAAVASFYGQGSYAFSPRLILLDEVFAGIDDAARAHCMGLIREFDLDFVITSEREWACYAALPGVAICQLQRREGIDAVGVSRWTWDGRAKAPAADPDRRFAPA